MVGRGLHRFLAPGCIDFPQQGGLGLVHLLIIHLRKGLQFRLQGLVFRIPPDTGRGQVQELRMQGERTDGVIGIGILPGMGHRGVVDRKELDYALTSLHGPVDQLLDVVELAHAETVLRAEGEDGDGDTGAAPRAGPEPGDVVGDFQAAAGGGQFREEVVRAFFPQDRLLGGRVHDDELVLEGCLHLQGDTPVRESTVIQQMELLPVAERAAARQGDGFTRADLGGGDAEGDIPLPRGRGTRIPEGNAVRATENDVAERCGIERGVRGTVIPTFADHQRRAAGGSVIAVRPPFAADNLPFLLHFEGIGVPVAEVAPRQFLLPHVGISRIHRIPLLPDAEHQRLTPLGMILDSNANIHSGLLVLMSIPDFVRQKQK